MDASEARALLRSELLRYRAKTYRELARDLLGKQDTYEAKGASGVTYYLEIQAFWDDKPQGVLRIRGAIDDGGIRAYLPLVEDFLLSPDGRFVDE